MSLEAVETFPHWMAAALLLGLRIAPVFAFAPPFTLVRTPVLVRVLVGLGLAITMVAADPDQLQAVPRELNIFAVAAAGELMIGIAVVVVFQLTFGAIHLAGRALDIQAGFGLALLIDPVSRSQTPLLGTVFAYAAAAIFFGANGHHDVLRAIAASIETTPIGYATLPGSPALLFEFVSIVFLAGMGVAGVAMLCLFLTDMTVAMLTRTLPQMNALILGFQTKTLVLLFVLPLSFGIVGVLLTRILTIAFEYLPRFI